MLNKFFAFLLFSLYLATAANYADIIGASSDGRYIVYADKGRFNSMTETRNDTVYIYDTEQMQSIASFIWEYNGPRREDGSPDVNNPLLAAVLDSEYRSVPLRKAYDFTLRANINLVTLDESAWRIYSFNDTSPLGAENSTVTLFTETDEPAGRMTFRQDKQNFTFTYTFNERIILEKNIIKKPYTWLRPETILINVKTRQIFTIFWVDEINAATLAHFGLNAARNYSDLSFGYCQAYLFKY